MEGKIGNGAGNAGTEETLKSGELSNRPLHFKKTDERNPFPADNFMLKRYFTFELSAKGRTLVLNKEDDVLLKIYQLLEEGRRDEAFALLVNDFLPALKKQAKNTSLPRHVSVSDRLSAIHEVLADTMSKLEEGKVRSNLPGYLYYALQRKLVREKGFLKRLFGKVFPSRVQLNEIESILYFMNETSDEDNILIFKVRKAFNMLSPDCKKRIQMKKIWGYSHQDILDEIPETGTIINSRNRLRDCMKKLREILEDN